VRLGKRFELEVDDSVYDEALHRSRVVLATGHRSFGEREDS
jgi:hypothetical protein